MHSVWLFWPEYVSVHCVDAGTETKPNRTETGKPAVVAEGKILSRLLRSVRCYCYYCCSVVYIPFIALYCSIESKSRMPIATFN